MRKVHDSINFPESATSASREQYFRILISFALSNLPPALARIPGLACYRERERDGIHRPVMFLVGVPRFRWVVRPGARSRAGIGVRQEFRKCRESSWIDGSEALG